MLKPKNNVILILSMIPVFYGVSLLLLTYYVLGDQVHYWRFYDVLASANTTDVMHLAQSHVGSSEPLSAYLLWAGAQLGIEKNVYISLLNVLLLTGIVLLIRRYKAPWYIYVLLLTNFYVIVLMNGAERLKIAYILLVYAALTPGRTGMFLALLSPLAHLSSFILLASLTIAKSSIPFYIFVAQFRIKNKHISALLILLPLSLFIFLYLQGGIAGKASGYMQRFGGLSELFNIALLLFVGLIATQNRFRMLLALLSLAGAVFLLGGMRVNMIAVSICIYLLLIENRLRHPLVIMLLVYFSMKSIPFINNIFVYGNGFGGWLF